MLDLIVLSPCFYENDGPARLMLESAHRKHLPVHLYGVGSPFIPHGADAQVLRLWELMSTEKKAEVVLVTDCRDVLFLAEPEEILLKFHSFNSPIVMSAENSCWPPDKDVVGYFYGRSPHGYDYVNAGQYIGDWDAVVAALKFLLDHYRVGGGLDNSQGWWAQAHMKNEIAFTLDRECKIFQTMSGGSGDHVYRLGSRCVNAMTHETPCTVHFNGNPNSTDPHGPLFRELFG